MTGCKRSYNVAHVARYRCLLWRVATCRQSVLPVPVPGCWGRRSEGEGVCNHIKIARLKAHRVAADSKRLSRQLLEYPVNHIKIEGVFWCAVSVATAACGRVFTSASLAPFSCHLLPATATAATHVAVVVVANMLSSCCMRRFLSLISIAIAIVARVSAIRSQLLALPTAPAPAPAPRSCCSLQLAACIDCAATNHWQTCFLLRGLRYLQQGVALASSSCGSRANSLSEFHTCELVLCDLQLIK